MTRNSLLKNKLNQGFTLIEVLLALTIVAIALVALIKATSQDVANTHRIKEKTISHWIAMQGVAMVQLGLLEASPSKEITQVTTMFGQRWYWRVKISQIPPVPSVQQIRITVSKRQAGPFIDPLLAFRYQS
ncbi:GspI family T2SS minor pseudopilin variant LspI [Legionella spiritensis]|uniref:Type II secretion system protein I n=1 Tax=Legionella spiritensis TaxID=452 RepID=A0A0W0Z4M2_LEGSP|nr:GspI family T2SS minor pseudopilin variant LspI [Legionella spiritensis]KTD64103.1 type II secretory pathway protein LspI [Legionella spiritensis]SNV37828.1 general secretion pathway protein I [Legionella spiritensis]